MTNFLVFVAYLLLSIFGLYKIKVAEFGFNFDFILGFTCYGFGFLIWIVVLRLFPISYAFPIAASMLIIGTQLIGFYLLNENLSVSHLSGVGFILIGVIILGYVNVSRV